MKIKIYFLLIFISIYSPKCSKEQDCLSCFNKKCLLCDNENFKFLKNNKCVNIKNLDNNIVNCVKYNLNMQCLQCKDYYFVSLNKKECLQFPSNYIKTKCIRYNINYIGIPECVCETGFYFNGNLCEVVSNIINFCEFYDENQQCNKCMKDYFLFDNICYKKEYTYDCLLDFGKYNFCEDCNFKKINDKIFIDYPFMNYYKLHKILTTNQILSYNYNNDTNFISFIPEKCIDSPVLNCIKYQKFLNFNDFICKKCKEGYYLKNNWCIMLPIKKIIGCLEYINDDNCLKCDNGYIIHNNLCFKSKNDKNCKELNQIDDKCIKCVVNYILEDNNCIRKSNIIHRTEQLNCSETENDGITCIKCRKGFYLNLNKKVCYIIKKGCIEYDFENNCITCDQYKLYYLSEGSCILKVIEDCYKLNFSGNCEICKNSKIPSKNNNSNSCEDQFFSTHCEYLKLNSCYNCKENFEKINNFFECKNNISENCLLYKDNKCFICKGDNHLSNDNICNVQMIKNRNNCLNGDPTAKQCKVCMKGYKEIKGVCTRITNTNTCYEYYYDYNTNIQCKSCYNENFYFEKLTKELEEFICRKNYNFENKCDRSKDDTIILDNCKNCKEQYLKIDLDDNFQLCYENENNYFKIENCLLMNREFTKCLICAFDYKDDDCSSYFNNYCIKTTDLEEGCSNCNRNSILLPDRSKCVDPANDISGKDENNNALCLEEYKFNNSDNEILCVKCEENSILLMHNSLSLLENFQKFITSKLKNRKILVNGFLKIDKNSSSYMIFGKCIKKSVVGSLSINNAWMVLLNENKYEILFCKKNYIFDGIDDCIELSLEKSKMYAPYSQLLGNRICDYEKDFIIDFTTNKKLVCKKVLNLINNCLIYKKTWNNDIICLLCEPEYYLSNNKLCLNNCMTYDNKTDGHGKCTKCLSDNYRPGINGVCLKNKIDNCKILLDSNNCHECLDNYEITYKLENNNMYYKCNKKLFTINNCNIYNKDLNKGCLICNKNYSPSGVFNKKSICIDKIINNCLQSKLIDGALVCTKCSVKGNTFFNGNCIFLNLEFCLVASTEYECKICDKNISYKKYSKCIKGTIDNCNEYYQDVHNSCKICKKGYFKLGNKKIFLCINGQNSRDSNFIGYDNNNEKDDTVISLCKNNYKILNNFFCKPFFVKNCYKNPITKKMEYNKLLNNYYCNKCKLNSKYYLNRDQNKCWERKNILFCQIYLEDEPNKCSKCQNNYYINSDKTICISNPSGFANCKIFKNNYICQECKRNYYLKSGTLNNRLIKYCKKIDTYIDNCNLYKDEETCLQCDIGYLILKEYNFCDKINFIDKNKCILPYKNKEYCNCIENYIFDPKKKECVNIPGCIKYEYIKESKDNNIICILCETNKIPSSNNLKCVLIKPSEKIDNCLFYDKNFKCLICDSNKGYFLNLNGLCFRSDMKINNCGIYLLGNKCTICPKGYTMNYKNECIKCSKDNCMVCNPFNTSICWICMNGYYMDNINNCFKSDKVITLKKAPIIIIYIILMFNFN